RASLAGEKAHFAVEDEERVHVVVVGVRFDALEVRLETELDRREVGELALDRVKAVAARELLSLARRGDDREIGRRPTVLGRVEAVEAGSVPAHVVGEAPAGCMEVEETGL